MQRSVQILSKESKWEYSAPPIPLSHWRGFDEEYINNICSFVNNIKEYTCQLRSGECTDISLRFGNVSDDTLLQHHDILLPRWRELANALHLYHSPNPLDFFSVHNIQLTSSVIDLLSPALYGNKIEKLTLNNNDFVYVSDGIKFAVEVIKNNPNMKQFFWDYNQLESIENARSVLDAVINHPSIERIRLESCFDGEIIGYDVLCYLLASGKSFQHIDFEGNEIETGGGSAIPDYIASNSPLKHLFLSDNKLDDSDAILIARALKHNTNLERLHLDKNNFTDIGKEALCKAVYDPTSLNAVSDCNHSCAISDFSKDLVLSNTGRDVRGKKIYLLLSERNGRLIDETETVTRASNVQHLNSEFDGENEENDSSLKLVPRVLECIHRYYPKNRSDGTLNEIHLFIVEPLSIIYEILRGWKMPELYESRAVGTVDMSTKYSNRHTS